MAGIFDDLIPQAAPAYGDGYFQRLASIESGGKLNAKNPKSSARGKYQWTDDTARQYGLLGDGFDYRGDEEKEDEAIKAFTNDNSTAFEKTLGRKPTEGELYLAHQQGPGGAPSLLANPDALAVDVVGRDAVLNNGGREDMTAQEFADQWTGKFSAYEPDENLNTPTSQGLFDDLIPEGGKMVDQSVDATEMVAPEYKGGQFTQLPREFWNDGNLPKTYDANDGLSPFTRTINGLVDSAPYVADTFGKMGRAGATGATYDTTSGIYGALDNAAGVMSDIVGKPADYVLHGLGGQGSIDPFAAIQEIMKRGQIATQSQSDINSEIINEGADLPQKLLSSAARSVGQSSAGLAASVLTGNPSLSLMQMGAVTGGQAMADAKAKGLSNAESLRYGLIQGGVEVATEAMPVFNLIKDMKAGSSLFKTLANQAIAEVPGEQIATLLQGFTEYSAINKNNLTFEQYLNEIPSDAAFTLGSTLLSVGMQTSGHYGLNRLLEGKKEKPEESATANVQAGLFDDLIPEPKEQTPEAKARRDNLRAKRMTPEEMAEEDALDAEVDARLKGEKPTVSIPEGVTDETPPTADMFGDSAPQEKGFTPTDKWQEVPKDAVVPPGLQIRMDQETGKTFARTMPAAPKKSDASIQKIVTPRGDQEIEAGFDVVDARDLITSDNEKFPQILQPRDRTRKSSDLQINDIASKLDPERLGASRTTDTGAPIVGTDGIVESGNGRIMAVRKAYEKNMDSAKNYKSWLEASGYDVSGIDQPVLIRRRRTELSEPDRVRFTIASNERTGAAMSTTERALADAKSITPEMASLYDEGDVNAPQNRGFIKKWIDTVDPADRGTMIGPDGELSQDGVRRARAALLANAYEDSDIVQSLMEDTDTEIKSIGNAMTSVAGKVSAFKAKVAQGEAPANLDITPQVTEAAKIIRDARAGGKSIEQVLSQKAMFTEQEISPITEKLIRSMYTPNLKRPLSAQKIEGFLRKYYEEAAKAQSGPNLLGMEDLTADQIIDTAAKSVAGISEPVNETLDLQKPIAPPLKDDADLDSAWEELSEPAKDAMREWSAGIGKNGNTLSRLRKAADALWGSKNSESVSEEDKSILDEIYNNGEALREKLRPHADKNGNIVLYRGVREGRGRKGFLNSLESFTLSEQTARNFAGEGGLVDKVSVPLDDVVYMPGYSEQEVIVRRTPEPKSPDAKKSDDIQGIKETGEKIKQTVQSAIRKPVTVLEKKGGYSVVEDEDGTKARVRNSWIDGSGTVKTATLKREQKLYAAAAKEQEKAPEVQEKAKAKPEIAEKPQKAPEKEAKSDKYPGLKLADPKDQDLKTLYKTRRTVETAFTKADTMEDEEFEILDRYARDLEVEIGKRERAGETAIPKKQAANDAVTALENRLAQEMRATGTAGEQTSNEFATLIRKSYENLLGRVGDNPALQKIIEENMGSGLEVGKGKVGSKKKTPAPPPSPIDLTPAEQKTLDTLEAEIENPPAFKPKEKPEPINTEAIEDFGEKIVGAKKDVWGDYKKSLSDALPEDLASIKLSVHFPEPDYDTLIAQGIDTKVLAAVKAIRDEIPSKPRVAYRLKRWADQVQNAREFSSDLLGSKVSYEKFMTEGEKRSVLAPFFKRVKLYDELGYPAFTKAKGWTVSSSDNVIENGERLGRTQWFAAEEGRYGTRFETREDAVNFLRDKLQAEPSGQAKQTKLDIYQITKTGEIVIGKKVGSGKYIDLKGGFKSAREARLYLSENQKPLLALLEKRKTVPPERRSTNDPRRGQDYRMGENISPERFAGEFGFRGVQFGNYVEQARRAKDLNNAYDALLDLSNALGVPSRAISLNGSLGLAFGARGSGGKGAPSAHYEPDHVVINLTKNSGAGSLAHEWWHALDNFFGKQREGNEFLTEYPRQREINRDGSKAEPKIRPEVVSAFADVMKAIKQSGILKRSKVIDKRRSKDYWSTDLEMSARTFEAYIIDKAKAKGESNDYLANIVDEKMWKASEALGMDEADSYPYPTDEEMAIIAPAYDKLFDTLETRETDKGVEFFQPAPPIESAAFKKWFGDSKVVDKDGKPLVVYHGTERGGFSSFDPYSVGDNTGNASHGFYFAENKQGASTYSGRQNDIRVNDRQDIIDNPEKYGVTIEKSDDGYLAYNDEGQEYFSPNRDRALTELAAQMSLSGGSQSGIYSVYLSMKNPYEVDFEGRSWDGADENGDYDGAEGMPDIENYAKENGYDGVIATNIMDEGRHGQGYGWSEKTYVVFEPTQIKSVDNKGSYNPDDANILYQSGLRSALLGAAEDLKQSKGSGEQMLNILRNTPGIKEEEVTWTGLDEFLKDKPSVTKQEITDYLKANQVKIEEVTLGRTGFEDIPYTVRGPMYDGSWDIINERGNYVSGGYSSEEAAINSMDRVFKDTNPTGETKFSQYTLPGGENYREVLLTLPEIKMDESKVTFKRYKEGQYNYVDIIYDGEKQGAWDDAGQGDGYFMSIMERRYNGDQLMGIKPKGKNFQSSHFDQPNILAHVRLNDRTDADGNKVLFVEEIQSDWHQAGRKKGYRTPFTQEDQKSLDDLQEKYLLVLDERKAAYQKMRDAAKADESIDEAQQEYRNRTKDLEDIDAEKTALLQKRDVGVPDAPFKKTWHEMAFRRVAQMAAQQGYDKIAWTTGEQQNDRFDLSKQVDEILYSKNEDGTFDVEVNKDGDTVASYNRTSADKLEEIVGKDVTQKIVNNEGEKTSLKGTNSLSGVDLKVGGAGMKGFYDKIIPTYAKKFGKKFGAQVGEAKLEESESQYKVEKRPNGDQPFVVTKRDSTEVLSRHATANEAWDAAEKMGGIQVHSLDITPEMRESAKAGFDLFQNEEQARGSVTFLDGKTILSMFEKADASTPFHEAGHIFLNTLQQVAQTEGAPQDIIDDWKIIQKKFGIKDKPTRDQHEKFARGFERYLREGKSPDPEMQSIFNKFKKWLTDIYKSVKDLDVDIDDEVRGVFDRMIAGKKVFRSEAEIQAEQSTVDAASQKKAQTFYQTIGDNFEKAKDTTKNIGLILARYKRKGASEAKKEVRKAQGELIQILEDSALSLNDRAKFIRTVRSIQTMKQLQKRVPIIQERVTKLLEDEQRRKLKAKIRNLLATTKVIKQSGKPVGKFTPEIQKQLDSLRAISKMGAGEAAVELEKRLESNAIPSIEEALENRLLAVMADSSSLSPQNIKQTLEALEALKAEGLEGGQARKDKRQARQAALRQHARTALENIKDDPMKDRTTLRSALAKKAGETISGFSSMYDGWYDTLDIIFGKDKTGAADALLEDLGYGVSDAFQNVKGRARRASDRAMKAMIEAGGFKNENQFLKQLHKDSNVQNLGVFTNSAEKRVRLQLSKSEARKRWMEFQDPSLVDTLTDPEGNGYSDTMIDALNGFLTPKDKAMAQAQLDFYRGFYDEVNETYRNIYGVDLPFNEFYSPISRQHNQNTVTDGFMKEMGFRRSTAPGGLKSRTANNSEIMNQSDVTVLQKHIMEMSHFIEMAEKVQDINAVFGRGDIRRSIQDGYGRLMTQNIDSFINDFTKGGLTSAESFNWIDKMRVNFTTSVLGAKPALAVKQMTSFVAYADTIPTKDFVAGVLDFAANPMRAARILNQSDMMKERGSNLERDMKDAAATQEFALFRRKPTLKNALLLPIKIGDKGSLLIGGWSVYRYHNKVLGKSQKEALREFDRVTSQTQQSSDLDQLSRWQRGGSFAKLFTMFTSSQNQFMRREIAAIRNLARGKITPQDFAKKIALYHFILPMFFQWVANFGRWDDEDQLRAGILGSFNGLFLIGDVLNTAIAEAFGDKYFKKSLNIVQFIEDTKDGIVRLADDDVSFEDTLQGMKELATGIGELTGLPLRQGFNIGEGIGNMAEGDVYGGVGKTMGWSPYVMDQAATGEDSTSGSGGSSSGGGRGERSRSRSRGGRGDRGR